MSGAGAGSGLWLSRTARTSGSSEGWLGEVVVLMVVCEMEMEMWFLDQKQ